MTLEQFFGYGGCLAALTTGASGGSRRFMLLLFQSKSSQRLASSGRFRFHIIAATLLDTR